MSKSPPTGRKTGIEIVDRQRGCRVDRRRLAVVARHVLDAHAPRSAEVEIAVVSDRRMSQLNRRYLNRRGPTDVLAFDLTERGTLLVSRKAERGKRGTLLVSGKEECPPFFQVVVSAETARRQAARFGHAIIAELALYVTHGLLHLLGFDDRLEADRRRMHARQAELLAELGIRPRG